MPATLRGKVEFEADGEGREEEVLDHLLRRSVAETFRARLAGLDLSGFVALVETAHGVATGDLVAVRRAARAGRPRRRAWPRCSAGSASSEAPTPAQAASAVEFVLEGLHLTRRLAKDVLDDGRVVYGSNAARRRRRPRRRRRDR